MKIKGLQKVTLIDYPGKISCTIFVFGCNFKCGFCHNPELVLYEEGNYFSKQGILDFLEKRKKYLEGVCITGGEPLLDIDFDFLKEIKKLGYFIKIDTNGSFPEKLTELIKRGLVDFVSMDIKSTKEKYPEVTGAYIDISKIEESIKIISLLENYEFRTTVVPDIHTIEDIKKIALWLNKITGKKPKKFSLQGFKNNGKFVNEFFSLKPNTPEKTLQEMADAVNDYFEELEIKF